MGRVGAVLAGLLAVGVVVGMVWPVAVAAVPMPDVSGYEVLAVARLMTCPVERRILAPPGDDDALTVAWYRVVDGKAVARPYLIAEYDADEIQTIYLDTDEDGVADWSGDYEGAEALFDADVCEAARRVSK
jgi:hypothetical protein